MTKPAEPTVVSDTTQEETKTDAYEVYGPGADNQGWDFIVYKSQTEAFSAAETDSDYLEEGEEIRIVYRKYTKEQWDEVIYE